jgi:hypothetical protein
MTTTFVANPVASGSAYARSILTALPSSLPVTSR